GARLCFACDSDHANGRHRWAFPGLGFSRLTDRLLRRLRMSRPKRELLHAWESDCRRIVARRAAHLGRLGRIRTKINDALREADSLRAEAARRASFVSAPLPFDDQ